MDNGIRKISTTNQKPSEAQLNTFNKYAHDGMCNEVISLLTGYSKNTVDKYIKEEPLTVNAWDNIKDYAAKQFTEASKAIQDKKNEAIDKKISALKQQLSELEAMKIPVAVPSFNWTVKYDAPKMIAKADVKTRNSQNYKKSRNYRMCISTKDDIVKLFSDHQWHTYGEVEAILMSHGYKKMASGYTHTLRRMIPDIIVERNRYILPA